MEPIYAVFYVIATDVALSYTQYNVRDNEGNLIKPSCQKAADNAGLELAEVNVKEYTKPNPVPSDFKDDITELDQQYVEDFPA